MDAIQEVVDYEEIRASMAAEGTFFGLRVKGRSMMPRICDGDTVIVRKQEEIENGDVAIVLVNGNEATCKRVVLSPTSLSLVPLNSEYEVKTFTKREVEELPVRIIGKVVELRGKL